MTTPQPRVLAKLWVRPGWVAYLVCLVGISVWGIAAAFGARVPLIVLAIAPILLIGLSLLATALIPSRFFERRLAEGEDEGAPTWPVPAPQVPLQPAGVAPAAPIASPPQPRQDAEPVPATQGMTAEPGVTTPETEGIAPVAQDATPAAPTEQLAVVDEPDPLTAVFPLDEPTQPLGADASDRDDR